MVSDILQTSAGPKSIPDKPSNQFYIVETTATEKVLSWSGYILLLLLSALLLGGNE
jgi:hypothetical protein